MVASLIVIVDQRIVYDTLLSLINQEVVEAPSLVLNSQVLEPDRPERVLLGGRIKISESVDIFVGRQEIAEALPFLGTEARVFVLVLGVVDIDVFVGNVEIAGQDDKFAAFLQ